MLDVCTRAATARFQVSDSAISQLAPTNQDRNRVTVHNESGVLFVGLGSFVSPTMYSYRLTGNATLELAKYVGVVSGIRQSGQGDVVVTQMI